MRTKDEIMQETEEIGNEYLWGYIDTISALSELRSSISSYANAMKPLDDNTKKLLERCIAYPHDSLLDRELNESLDAWDAYKEHMKVPQILINQMRLHKKKSEAKLFKVIEAQREYEDKLHCLLLEAKELDVESEREEVVTAVLKVLIEGLEKQAHLYELKPHSEL